MKRALIAMSGGVDSSVAAFLARREGYDCLGVTLRLWDNAAAGVPEESGCCALSDAEDAREAAHLLGIPHVSFNFADDFRREVLDPFVRAYDGGRTPNPCVDCNRTMKFGKLLRRARELGCAALVTGHYARVETDGDRYLLKKAADETKDQSYVLYMLGQEDLASVRFPLGDLRKTEVRALARSLGLANAGKRDSQDLCFAPDGDIAGAVERLSGRPGEPGAFLGVDGRALGRHRGLRHYTVGQRRGLGVSGPEALYVCELCARTNTVTLGPERALWARALEAEAFHWVSGIAPDGPVRCAAKIRYRQPEQPALAEPAGPESVRVVFDEPQRAAAPGQSVVLYDGDVVLGGGIIRKKFAPPGGGEV